ncbi:MAG: phenylacetate--CoA ligase family protein [Planctomycetia bacterium]|nr:phenylacetate--CoA ligase family protein [Planctomycetia bacterium]
MSLYQRLVRDVLYPAALWRSGDFNQWRYLREFERTQYLPAEELRQLQWRRLQALLHHAYARCEFYRERFDRAGLTPGELRGLEDLGRLPLLEKSEIQEQRDRLVARDWPRHDLLPNHTGGSTGAPLSFFLSNDRLRSRNAATTRHNRWAGWDVGDKSAVLWGAPRDLPANRWRPWLRNTILDRQLFLDTGHLTETRLLAYHEALQRFRPKVMLAYARSALLFARFLHDRNLKPYRPHSIVTSAEVLEPADRALIEQVFGCPVFNRYGCREVSVIASECEHHAGLHVMAEGLYVEIVKDGRAAQPGELGSIVITDLLNHAMPLIRYRIGDLGAWAVGDCPCGRHLPRLQQVAGRVTDFLVGPDGRLVSGVFLATYLIGQRPSLGQVQLVQEVAGQVRFRIKRGANFREAEDLDFLQAATRRHLGAATVIDWDFVNDLPPEASGKHLFSRSSVALEYLRPGKAVRQPEEELACPRPN